MGRQFSILATSVDLQRTQDILSKVFEIDYLSNQATDDLRDLVPIDSLALPSDLIGKASLFCYLAPRGLPRKIVAERDSPVKVHIDLFDSHLIEIWRPFYRDGKMREGRVFYQPKRRIGCGEKDPEFIAWAERVAAGFRKSLKFNKVLGAYVGEHAAKDIAEGTLTVIS